MLARTRPPAQQRRWLFFLRCCAGEAGATRRRYKRNVEGDQLNDVLDDAVAAQPSASATGDGIRQELAALTPPAQQAQQPIGGEAPRLSRKGIAWNPATDVSPPVETARGTWKKLPRGATPGTATGATDPQAVVVAREHCAMAFDTGGPLLNQLFPLPAPGDWQPTEEERDSIERHLSRFYERYPHYMADLPPGAALAMAVGAYALPRLLALPQGQALLTKLLQRPEPALEPLRSAA